MVKEKHKKINIIGITLARGGSKSIKDKNITPILGKPLIEYTIREAHKSKFIRDYIVSTDSKKISNLCRKLKVEVPFLRPKSLSNDKASSVIALKHAVKFMENKMGIKYDYVVEIMCTNPLKNVRDIDNCIKKIIATKADSVIAVHQIEDHHPSRVKKIIQDKIVDFCIKEKPESRRQDLRPKAYVRSGSIYVLKRDYLMYKSKRYGSKNSRPYILPDKRAINIDTRQDLLLAEQLLSI